MTRPLLLTIGRASREKVHRGRFRGRRVGTLRWRMSRKSGDRFSDKDMRKRENLEHKPPRQLDFLHN
jgi:hypothetical protein